MPLKKHQLLYEWLIDIRLYGKTRRLYKNDNGFYSELCYILGIFLPQRKIRAKETIQERHTLCKLLSIGDKRIFGIYNQDLRKCCTCEEIFESFFKWCPCCGRLLRIKKRDKAYTMYDKMHDDSGY